MDRIRKREFTGNALLFWLLCVTVVGIPAGVLYLVNGTVETEFEVDDAQAFWDDYSESKRWWRFWS